MWPFKKQQRDINQLIYDYAEYHRPADMRELITLLKQTELFPQVVSGVQNLPEGTHHVVGPNDNIQVAHAKIGVLNLVLFFVDAKDARLRRPFVSMNGLEAMQMVLKIKADGILIQNNKTSHFGLDAEGIREALVG